MPMRTGWLAVALVATLAAASCGGDDEPAGPDRSVSPSPSEGDTETPEPVGSYTEIEFAAADGEQRSGRLFGEGEVAVVLSHMGRPGDGQDDWLGFAEDLADRGFLVLTYEGRNTLSETWQDVLGAVRELRDRDVRTVIAAGASIGAMASLYATIRADSDVNAVLWLAGVLNNSGYEFSESDVSDIGCPMLIAAGAGDDYGATEDAEQLHDWTPDVSELLIVDSEQHGTDILSGPDAEVAEQLRQAMIDFIDDVAAEPVATC